VPASAIRLYEYQQECQLLPNCMRYKVFVSLIAMYMPTNNSW